MTKNKIRKFALDRNYKSSYSGKQKRFFFKRWNRLGKMDVHKLINDKVD